MPRSGTSLVEQIITSHSEVFGGGELPILSNIIRNNFIEDDKLLNNDFEKKNGRSFNYNKIKKIIMNLLNFLIIKKNILLIKHL